jgi:hypothetical protein
VPGEWSVFAVVAGGEEGITEARGRWHLGEYAERVTNSSGPGHAAIRQTESGCLALADISGYTPYLAGAELDHAQDVLEDLTDTVVRSLSPPMKLSKLEGDAVFVYMPGNRVDASMLLGTLDAAYFAFRRRQDAIDRATQCDCNA